MTVFLRKASPVAPWLTGDAKKEFPPSRRRKEAQFPLGNPFSHAAVRATRVYCVGWGKRDFLERIHPEEVSGFRQE